VTGSSSVAIRPRPSVAPGSLPEPAVLVRGLVKRYGDRTVVDGLDLTVDRGAIVALLGPNGAGKTTTVEILEGYRRADGGTARMLGLDPATDGRRLRPRIGLMLQEGGIYPQARPRELLHLYARFYRDPLDPDALLELVGLGAVAETRWRRLSGGERQRLSLALALVGRPEVIILDEPTAGMDPAAKAATRELIASLRADGTTVLLTTHELHDVERLADRIAIMADGRLVAEGTPKELLAGAAHRLRLRLERALDPDEREVLQRAIGGLPAGPAPAALPGQHPILVDDGAAGRYRIEGIDPDPSLVASVAAALARLGLLVVELRSTGSTLEERYLELVGPGALGPDADGPDDGRADAEGERDPNERPDDGDRPEGRP
jgi:ABC-2 type transport system ATP-binding protein